MIKYARTKEKIHSVQKKKASTHIVSGLIVTLRVHGIVAMASEKTHRRDHPCTCGEYYKVFYEVTLTLIGYVL